MTSLLEGRAKSTSFGRVPVAEIDSLWAAGRTILPIKGSIFSDETEKVVQQLPFGKTPSEDLL